MLEKETADASVTPLLVLATVSLLCPIVPAAAQQPSPRDDKATTRDDKSARAGRQQLKSSDRKFVMNAAQGNMAEVELGRLASERGASPRVKQFGQRMVDDHGKANGELMQLAQQKGVTPP